MGLGRKTVLDDPFVPSELRSNLYRGTDNWPPTA